MCLLNATSALGWAKKIALNEATTILASSRQRPSWNGGLANELRETKSLIPTAR
jgi:hypothetical protein